MDTSAVIQLSCQAAESVLRFRAVGFTSRPVIDLQSFRAAITAQIEKVAKNHQHRFEVPLAEVVTYAGIGAARAAQQWNDISHKENHVVTEWFRNCVCNLVSGVVSDIGQMAFEDQGMNACMYLEPDDYDPFDVPSYSRSAPVSKPAPKIPSGSDNYYGFPQVETRQEDEPSPDPSTTWTTVQAAPAAPPPLPLRHEISKGYAALEQLAASRKDTSARADFIQKTKRLRNASEPSCDGVSQERLLKRPEKRARQESNPAPSRRSPLSRDAPLSARDPMSKAQRYFFWTDDEVTILVTARDLGRSWTEIENMLPRHSWMACQAKFRQVKNKEAESSLRQAADKDLEAGPGHKNGDKTVHLSSESLDGDSMDIDIDHDRQDSGESSAET